jgi:hypothetical protein
MMAAFAMMALAAMALAAMALAMMLMAMLMAAMLMVVMMALLLEEDEVDYQTSVNQLNDVSSRDRTAEASAHTCIGGDGVNHDGDHDNDAGDDNGDDADLQIPTLDPALFADASMIVKTVSPALKNSRILEHMKNQIEWLRSKYGGHELCISKPASAPASSIGGQCISSKTLLQ